MNDDEFMKMASNTVKSIAAGSILALVASISIIVNNLNRADSSYLAWDTPVVANGIYKCYVDDNPIPITLVNVICDGTTCKVPISELKLVAGHHLVQMTTTVNGVESVKSIPIEVNFIVTTDK